MTLAGAWVTSRMGLAITASAPWEACETMLGKKCSLNEKMLLIECVWSYFKRRLRIVCGCPWSLFGCQGNFFLWVITGARDSWLTTVWLWPCARTADARALRTRHSKRLLCQLYLVLWCMDVLLLLAQLPLTLCRFMFSGLSYSAQISYLQFSFNSAATVVGWQPASTALGGRIAVFSTACSDTEHKTWLLYYLAMWP